MCKDYTFRNTRCSSGILIHCYVISRYFYFWSIRSLLLHKRGKAVKIFCVFNRSGKLLFPSEYFKKNFLNRRQKVTNGCIYNLFYICTGTKVNHPVCQEIKGDQHLCAGIIKLVFKLPVRIQRVVHYGNTADFNYCVVSDNTGDQVWKKDSNSITFSNS